MKKQELIWLSYDLGIQGDYEGIYKWLDMHGAKECGDSLAFIHYEYDGDDLLKRLKSDLNDSFNIDNKTRIYVVRLNSKNEISGKFIFGSRKNSPWKGYGYSEDADEEDVK